MRRIQSLIFARDQGKLVGKCDARCYNAKHKECHCVCGGMNHGVGLEKALVNTQANHKQFIKVFTKQRGLKKPTFKIPALRAGVQLNIFDAPPPAPKKVMEKNKNGGKRAIR